MVLRPAKRARGWGRVLRWPCRKCKARHGQYVQSPDKRSRAEFGVARLAAPTASFRWAKTGSRPAA